MKFELFPFYDESFFLHNSLLLLIFLKLCVNLLVVEQFIYLWCIIYNYALFILIYLFIYAYVYFLYTNICFVFFLFNFLFTFTLIYIYLIFNYVNHIFIKNSVRKHIK